MLVLAFRVNYQDDRGSLFAGNLHDKEEARLATRFQENTFSISWRIPSPRRSGLTHRSTSGIRMGAAAGAMRRLPFHAYSQ